MKKPLIGITSNFSKDYKYLMKSGWGGNGQEWSALANEYSEAIIKAGGIPVAIPVVEDKEYIKDLVGILDGIIMSGGNDVEPLRSGQRNNLKIGNISLERDEQEMFILEEFYCNSKKPMLFICRGMQIFNIFLGGNLILDLPSSGYLDHSLINIDSTYPIHSIDIEKNSMLYEIIKEKEVFVNTLHHQAIDRLGKGIKVVAKSDDGVVEAIEGIDEERFILGLQWHPELVSKKDKRQRLIFDAFIESCK